MSKSRALMYLAAGFITAWMMFSITSATVAGGYRTETAAAFWAVLAWFMLGGSILATVAAVAAYEPTPDE